LIKKDVSAIVVFITPQISEHFLEELMIDDGKGTQIIKAVMVMAANTTTAAL